jgi:hypothetical protein
VELAMGDPTWATKALVDTGAPYTIFDRGSGDALGVDFSDPTARQRVHRLGGESRAARSAHVQLHLVNVPFDDVWWDAEVDFLVDEWEMPYGLLGQAGFLDKWVVTFNRYRNYFVVQEINDFEETLPIDTYEAFLDADRSWERPTLL